MLIILVLLLHATTCCGHIRTNWATRQPWYEKVSIVLSIHPPSSVETFYCRLRGLDIFITFSHINIFISQQNRYLLAVNPRVCASLLMDELTITKMHRSGLFLEKNAILCSSPQKPWIVNSLQNKVIEKFFFCEIVGPPQNSVFSNTVGPPRTGLYNMECGDTNSSDGHFETNDV